MIRNEAALLKNCNIKNVGNQEDNLQIIDNSYAEVSEGAFSNTNMGPNDGDELASVVKGSTAIFYRQRFKNTRKSCFDSVVGDDYEIDISSLSAKFVECIFEDNSRRNPFGQLGQVRLHRCLIKNWGTKEYFNVKSYGIRAGKHAQVMASDCIFIQRPFSYFFNRNFISDIIYQETPYLLPPGWMRGAYADWGGQIKLYNCYKNRSWIWLQNHKGSYMSKEKAIELETYLEKVVPH